MISVFVDKEGLIYVQRIVVIYITWHVLATKNQNEVGSTNNSLHVMFSDYSYTYHTQTIIGTASFLLSWSIHIGDVMVAQSLNVKHVTPPQIGPIGLPCARVHLMFSFLFHHPLLLPKSQFLSLFDSSHPRRSLIVVKQFQSTTKPTSLHFTQQSPPFCLQRCSHQHLRSTQSQTRVQVSMDWPLSHPMYWAQYVSIWP